MKVGFVGLGMMGKPMAINLVRAGHDVTVVNRSQRKVRELAGMGAYPGASPAAAATDADVVCLCLLSDDIVEDVLCGSDGVLAGASSGTVVLDHSTVHPEFARRMEIACSKQGVIYLDAPVSGAGQVAMDGKLTVMVGGDYASFIYVQPLLNAVAANPCFMGPVGSGNMAKLINNLVKDINQVAVMETFALAAKLGMDCTSLFHALRTASATSRQLERIVPKILDRSFEQSSYVSTNIKDQGLIQWMVDEAGLDLPLRNAARDFWLRAAQEGLADADPTEAIKVLERETGVEVAGSPPEPRSSTLERRNSSDSHLKFAFIGLGMMGRPIAENMVKAGLDVTVVNRSQSKVAELAAMGATVGTTPAAAARDADVVVLCLSGEATIDLVLRGEAGVLSSAKAGTVILDHSTVHPDFACDLARACAEKGLTYLDAPVSGTGAVAWEGNLTVMVGGDALAFERVRPALNAISSQSLLMGPTGSGNLTKLMNNMTADAYQIGIMEAFVLAAKLGMDVGAMLEVMQTASAATRQIARIGPKILDRAFFQTSKLSGHVRGQEVMGLLAKQAGVTLPLREVVQGVWIRGEAAGLGPDDPAKVIALYEDAAGIEVHR